VWLDVKRGYAASYVFVEKASGKLAGFYTLSSHSIPLTELAADVAGSQEAAALPKRSGCADRLARP